MTQHKEILRNSVVHLAEFINDKMEDVAPLYATLKREEAKTRKETLRFRKGGKIDTALRGSTAIPEASIYELNEIDTVCEFLRQAEPIEDDLLVEDPTYKESLLQDTSNAYAKGWEKRAFYGVYNGTENIGTPYKMRGLLEFSKEFKTYHTLLKTDASFDTISQIVVKDIKKRVNVAYVGVELFNALNKTRVLQNGDTTINLSALEINTARGNIKLVVNPNVADWDMFITNTEYLSNREYANKPFQAEVVDSPLTDGIILVIQGKSYIRVKDKDILCVLQFKDSLE